MQQTTYSFEEQDLFTHLSEQLPEFFYMEGIGKNNCYRYNEVTFYDITDQQKNNDFNLSIGIIGTKMIATGAHYDEIIDDVKYFVHTMPNRKTFEFHVWSVNKKTPEVIDMINKVKLSLLSLGNCISIDDKINCYYKTLDNTTKAMTDCVFTADFNCVDIIKEKAEQDYDSAELKEIVFINQK